MERTLNIATLILSVILFIDTKCSYSYQVKTEKDAVDYLTHYGYVDPETMPLGFTLKDCNKKLKEFQKLARVDVTGVFDASTMKAMNAPRCGCPDSIHLSFKETTDRDTKTTYKNDTSDWSASHRHHHHHSHEFHERFGNSNSTSKSGRHTGLNKRSRRTRRYVLSERLWEKKLITYSIVRYPSRYNLKISTRQIEDAIQKAFHIWGQHVNLQFEYQPNDIIDINVDIEISFASTYHGDNSPFDGPGNTLAHAFFPGAGIGGDVHFEEDEDWSVESYKGVNLLYVAVHEIGHSLGLGHSSDYGAIMYPWYRGYIPNLQLHSDDISGVHALYGRPGHSTNPAPNTTPKPTSTTTFKPITSGTTTDRAFHPKPESGDNYLCEDPNIDAITTMFGDAILVFQGNNVYEIGQNGEGVLPGWPKHISSFFKGLEGDLDCVLTRSNGKTYFFKGRKYWRFTGKTMDPGYPRAISEYFPGIPNNLDASFEWDEEFVFTKGTKFWRFNTRKRPQVSSFFPMPISHWGLNNGINATFTAPNRSVYFLQGPYFWEFDTRSHKIMQDYSRPSMTTERWFGCQEP